MRIAFYTPNLHGLLTGRGIVGGAERQVLVLARALRELGHEPCFVAPDADLPARTSTPAGDIYRAERMGSLLAHALPPTATRLVSALAHARADACYVRVATPHLAVVAAWARLTGRRAVFAAAHDTDCVRGPGTEWLSRRQRRLYVAGLRAVHAILAQHEGQVRAFRHELGLESTVIPNAVELSPEAEPDGSTVVSMTRPDPRKRADRFVELARRLPERKFVLIGSLSPEALAGGAPGNLRLTGQLPPTEAESYLARAALLVGTSSSEGFPNVYLEAWARGVPVVSVDVDPGGVIRWEGLGAVCPRADELPGAVERLLGDREARRAIGARARAYVAEHHAPGRIARALEAAVRGHSRP